MKKPLILNITNEFNRHKIIGQIVLSNELENMLRDNLNQHKKNPENNKIPQLIIKPSAFLEGNNIAVLSDVGLFIE